MPAMLMPSQENEPAEPKPPLSHEILTDVIDLSLFAGQLLLQYGAETARIEETVHRIGTGLGCDWMDIFVTADGLIVTTTSGDEFRTKIRRVTRLGVNFAKVAAVNALSRRVYAGEIDRQHLREALNETADSGPVYPRWVVISMVGLACGAFSRLFGGDLPVFLVTVVAASMAMFVRQVLTHLYFNLFLTIAITAFVAGIVSSIAVTFALGSQPELAMAASVLLLVPGVPLINSAEDLLQGYVAEGLARGLSGGLVTLGIATGLTFAMVITGVGQL